MSHPDLGHNSMGLEIREREYVSRLTVAKSMVALVLVLNYDHVPANRSVQ